MTPPHASRIQSTLSTLLLLSLSVALAPISLTLSLIFSLTHPHTNHAHHARTPPSQTCAGETQPTVMVNGARMQKSLVVCRAFARRGWRVVLVDEGVWGWFAASRVSNSVAKFCLVPDVGLPASEEGGVTPYVRAMVEVALRERVHWFFPCSGARSTYQDAVVAQMLLETTCGVVRSVIQTPELVEALHEKHRFIALAQRLQMAVPSSEIVYSVEHAMDRLKADAVPRWILKSASELDDVGRGDMTLYPLVHATTREVDWEATRQRLSSLAIPLCERTPYILQEFIGDRIHTARPEGAAVVSASEWCTHATVVDGKLTAFVCCPSNDMLMTYYPASDTVVGELGRRWTSTFLYRLEQLGRIAHDESIPPSPFASHMVWDRHTLVGRHAPANARITGQFSMDFIYQPATTDGQPERLVAIECNPRVHTAICLLAANTQLAEALIPASLSRNHAQRQKLNRVVREMDQLGYTTNTTVLPQSWIGHDLPARLLPNLALLPPFAHNLMSLVHPLWSASATKQGAHVVEIPHGLGTKSFDLAKPGLFPPFTDPAFAKDDPWPFWALYHLQWPQLLLWQLVVRRNKWSRINVSTARIFEC